MELLPPFKTLRSSPVCIFAVDTTTTGPSSREETTAEQFSKPHQPAHTVFFLSLPSCSPNSHPNTDTTPTPFQPPEQSLALNGARSPSL
ncbi:hypothetical protein Mapa_001451 [Marchantia paleacea]|nr:hypothetical protein Mapa_001451 [Marchantia paleacea]